MFCNEKKRKPVSFLIIGTNIFDDFIFFQSLHLPIWFDNGINKFGLLLLQSAQNAAIWLIKGSHKYDRASLTPVYKELHWLRIKERLPAWRAQEEIEVPANNGGRWTISFGAHAVICGVRLWRKFVVVKIVLIARIIISLGGIHKGRPAKIVIFRPPLPRLSGVVRMPQKTLPPSTDVQNFYSYLRH